MPVSRWMRELFARLQAESGVEVGERLVKQKDARHLHQGARDRYTLLLTAGELARAAFHQLADLHEFRDLHRPVTHLLLREFLLAAEVSQREGDVVQHGQVRI